MKKRIALPSNEKRPAQKRPKINSRQESRNQARFGNFKSYYGVRGVDERVKFMEKSWFQGKRWLDVGCNSGNLTLQIAAEFCPAFVHGIDLDESLISQAKYQKRFRESLRHPIPISQWTTNELLVAAEELAATNSDNSNNMDFFPLTMPLMFGALPNIPPDFEGKTLDFPHNVKFESKDILKDCDCFSDVKFDIITLFSVTKWIHLNHGDQGLRQLFLTCRQLLNDVGGRLIIEPQGIESYRNYQWIKDDIIADDPNCTWNIIPWSTTGENKIMGSIYDLTFSQLLIETGFSEIRVIKESSVKGENGFSKRPIWMLTTVPI